MNDGLQISRVERVPETIAFCAGAAWPQSASYSPMTLSSAGNTVFGAPVFVALRDRYCNAIVITVASATDTETAGEKTFVVRLTRYANQQGTLASDILIPFSSTQGIIIPVPLFCDIYSVAIHAASNVIGTNTNLVTCLFV